MSDREATGETESTTGAGNQNRTDGEFDTVVRTRTCAGLGVTFAFVVVALPPGWTGRLSAGGA
jgi:hypothetical protein